ncbi:MAG: deoxyribose-phosphate aldolase [Bdellovibrionales bacterium RIFOXYC2_FULL_39_8]|nr:MAG: deoxyribose-phosphate aldolase [Bdellovibrionales bacterium RIFOXYC2_FULL_39_8]
MSKVLFNQKLASMIDHTILRPTASEEEILAVCEEAIEYKFVTVCVYSKNIPLVAKKLKGSGVLPIAVVGFPTGIVATEEKVKEAKMAKEAGALEIDMVINLDQLRARDYRSVLEDIEAVVVAAAPALTKVIIEASNISDDEKIIACALSKAAGAAFVKTSTGFGKGGATTHDVALMRRVVGEKMGVKASGGVRTRQEAEAMIAAGANRIGASASVAIVSADVSSSKDGGRGY